MASPGWDITLNYVMASPGWDIILNYAITSPGWDITLNYVMASPFIIFSNPPFTDIRTFIQSDSMTRLLNCKINNSLNK
jgi:hypothetical protein